MVDIERYGETTSHNVNVKTSCLNKSARNRRTPHCTCSNKCGARACAYPIKGIGEYVHGINREAHGCAANTVGNGDEQRTLRDKYTSDIGLHPPGNNCHRKELHASLCNKSRGECSLNEKTKQLPSLCTYLLDHTSTSATSKCACRDLYDRVSANNQTDIGINHTLPYLEIPPEFRLSSCQEASNKRWSTPPETDPWNTSRTDLQLRPWSFKVTILCFLVSVLLMCKGTVCFVYAEDSSHFSTLSPFLTYINGSLSQPYLSQPSCVPLTSNLTNHICDIRLKESKEDRKRIMLLRKANTNFCGLPLVNVLSKEAIYNVTQRPSRVCSRALRHVERTDADVSDMYCQFMDVINRIDEHEMFDGEDHRARCVVSKPFIKHCFRRKLLLVLFLLVK